MRFTLSGSGPEGKWSLSERADSFLMNLIYLSFLILKEKVIIDNPDQKGYKMGVWIVNECDLYSTAGPNSRYYCPDLAVYSPEGT